MQLLTGGALTARLRNWFPDREFFMRSQGQVRFITISSRMQFAAASVAACLFALWIAIMASIAISHILSANERQILAQREARAASDERAVSRYRQDVAGVTSDLQRRQDFIEKMVQAHVGELPAAPAEHAAVPKVSLATPGADKLTRIAAHQLAFVERLTRLADQRGDAAADKMRRLGLDPGIMLAALDDRSAQGGPLLRLTTSADGSVDPRFQRMGSSLARMDALERGLQGVPQVLPASLQYISSGFGYRTDPFDGAAAFHAGLDFRGPIGAPIYAAAKGVISFAGQRSGYGNCIEVSHGNGLLTRYAHMSEFHATVGQQVAAGAVIGAIGSTGRSTGPHLHFEVRINDRPVNPRPFLEAASHVSQKNSGSTAPAQL